MNVDSAPAFDKAAAFKIQADMDCSIHREPICRPPRVSPTLVYNITNFEIEIDMQLADLESKPSESMRSVTGLIKSSKKEIVRIILVNFGMVLWHGRLRELFNWIQDVKSVKSVLVTALTAVSENENYNSRVLRAKNRSMYTAVKEVLEPTLGPSTWHDGTMPEQRHLKFQPRPYWASPASCQSLADTDTESGVIYTKVVSL